MTRSTATQPVSATPMSAEYVVRSDLLGDFTIHPNSAIEFPQGLLGLSEYRRFALVRAGSDTVYWMQSIDQSAILFLLVDPFAHFSEYSIEISPADVFELGATNPSDVVVLSIVTLPPPGSTDAPTANLQGPVAINLRLGRGKQVICVDADHGVRRAIDLQVGL